MKRKLAAAFLFFILVSKADAQNQKEVYGSFEAGCKVFNYHFKQASNQINAFSISEIAGDLYRQIMREDVCFSEQDSTTYLISGTAILCRYNWVMHSMFSKHSRL